MALSCCKKIVCFILRNHIKACGYFCCLNCLHSFSTENKLKEHKSVCKNHDYCYIDMPKDKSILKYNHGERSTKIQFIIYADVESLLDEIDAFYSNRKNS